MVSGWFVLLLPGERRKRIQGSPRYFVYGAFLSYRSVVYLRGLFRWQEGNVEKENSQPGRATRNGKSKLPLASLQENASEIEGISSPCCPEPAVKKEEAPKPKVEALKPQQAEETASMPQPCAAQKGPDTEATAPKQAANDSPKIEVLIPLHSAKDFQKIKVSELRDELEARGLPTHGIKEELISRLLAVYNEDTVVVGRDVEPHLGMRVRHVNGPSHGSSKGIGGRIEFLPGRGAFRADEKSASVRWDADKSDVRGPYYTAEPCDRGSGIGTPKFDLICVDVAALASLAQRKSPASSAPLRDPSVSEVFPAGAGSVAAPEEEAMCLSADERPISGLQADDESSSADAVADTSRLAVAAAPSLLVAQMEMEDLEMQDVVEPSEEAPDHSRGTKRSHDGCAPSRLCVCLCV